MKVVVTKEKVVQTIINPEKVSKGHYGRKIAQSSLTENLILRVVYEEMNDKITIITAYPGERRRYEDNI
ncbi:MAG: DUF4258 domain-containing protein [bacterium]|nr:DUF4258 domain-containing protein [bacterium]